MSGSVHVQRLYGMERIVAAVGSLFKFQHEKLENVVWGSEICGLARLARTKNETIHSTLERSEPKNTY